MSFNGKGDSNADTEIQNIQRNVNEIQGETYNNSPINQGNINKQIINYYNDIEKTKEDSFIITQNTDIKYTPYFVGRENELEKLRESIKSGNKLVLVSGMGGIGKTHLCRFLYQEYVTSLQEGNNNNIDHIGYLNYDGSFNDTLVNGLKYSKSEKYEENLELARRKLFELSKKRLVLFVDNVTNTMAEDNSLKMLYELNCAVVITSRKSAFERFNLLKIDVLSLENCREIFIEIYETFKVEQKDDLDYILSNLAARHTKTVELLASIAKNKAWEVSRLRKELEEPKFQLVYKSEGDKKVLQTEYEKLFDMTGLSENEVNVLEAFSMMPYLPLSISLCNEMFLKDVELNEDDEIFNELNQKGWLERNENDFSMHPVISEVIFSKQKPKINYHLNLLKSCTKLISVDEKEVFTKALPFLPFAVALADKLFSECENIAYISTGIGVIYFHKGEYDKALEYFEKALEIREKLLLKNNQNTIIIYNNIAEVHDRKGEYDKSLEWYKKALQISEKILEKENPVTAYTYNNIAGVYVCKEEYDKAFEFYKKALQIREKVLGENHLDTATTYNDIAGVYYIKGEFDKEFYMYEKTLQINEKVLGKNHPNTAIIYNNIAGAYTRKAEFDKALEFYKKALQIREKIFGKEHPNTAATYKGIATLLYVKEEYDQALEWHVKAFKILNNRLGFNHPYTINVLNNIHYTYIKSGKIEESFKEWLHEKSSF